MWALNISGEIVNLVNGNTITLGQTSALWEIVLTLNVTGFDGKGRFCEYKDLSETVSENGDVNGKYSVSGLQSGDQLTFNGGGYMGKTRK